MKGVQKLFVITKAIVLKNNEMVDNQTMMFEEKSDALEEFNNIAPALRLAKIEFQESTKEGLPILEFQQEGMKIHIAIIEGLMTSGGFITSRPMNPYAIED